MATEKEVTGFVEGGFLNLVAPIETVRVVVGVIVEEKPDIFRKSTAVRESVKIVVT